MKEYEVLVCYNRNRDVENDYFKVIRVKAESAEIALNLVNGYRINDMFDEFERDYVEDSLYGVKILSSHPVQ